MTEKQRRSSGGRDTGVRERLLEAALVLLAEGGTRAITSRAVADRAGENLASITYYFGGKRALVHEALPRHARVLVEPPMTALAGDAPPAQRMAEAIVALNALITERPVEVRGYVQALAAATTEDGIGDELRSLLRDLAAPLAADVESQKVDGSIPPWVEPDAMAQLIIALANGVATMSAIDPERVDPAAISAQFALLLSAAALPPAGR